MLTFRDLPPAPKFTEPGTCTKLVAKEEALADLWFPVYGEKVSEFAVETCRTCPARVECLAFAMENPGVQGLYGGWTFQDGHRDRAVRSRLAHLS